MQARRRAGRDARPDIFSQSQQQPDPNQYAAPPLGNQPPLHQQAFRPTSFPPSNVQVSTPPQGVLPSFKPTTAFQAPALFNQPNNNYPYSQPQNAHVNQPSHPGMPMAQPPFMANGLPNANRIEASQNAENYDSSWSWGADDANQTFENTASSQQPYQAYNNANRNYNQQVQPNAPSTAGSQQYAPPRAVPTPPGGSSQYASFPPHLPSDNSRPPVQSFPPPLRQPAAESNLPPRPPSSYQAPPLQSNSMVAQQPQYAPVQAVQQIPYSHSGNYNHGYADSMQHTTPATHLEQTGTYDPRSQVSYQQQSNMPDTYYNKPTYSQEQAPVEQQQQSEVTSQTFGNFNYENHQTYYNQNSYGPEHSVIQDHPKADEYENQNLPGDQAVYYEGLNQAVQQISVITAQGLYPAQDQYGEPTATGVQGNIAHLADVQNAAPLVENGRMSVPVVVQRDEDAGAEIQRNVHSLSGEESISAALPIVTPINDPMQHDPFRNRTSSKSCFSMTSSMNQQDHEGSVTSTQRSERNYEEYYNDHHETYHQDVSNDNISDRLESVSLNDVRSRAEAESSWEHRNGENHTRTSAVSFALDALDTIPGPRLPMDSDAWSRASTWGSGYDDHPRSILSSPPNEFNENNGAKSIERSNSFDGSSIVESYAPGSVDSESLSNTQFDERGSKAVSGRTTPFEDDSVSRNLSREASFDRCSREGGEDASDVVALPPSSISFHDGFEGILKPTRVTDSTASLVGSQSMISSMTNGSPRDAKQLDRFASQTTVIEHRHGRLTNERTERTDAEGSLDVDANIAPLPIQSQSSRISSQDEADGAGDVIPQQSRQAAYGQPAPSLHPNKFSRPPSAASRPSPATTPNVAYTQQGVRTTEPPISVPRPNYPEGPNYVAEDDGSNSTPPGLSHSTSFSRELPPSSQRMVPGMSGGDLRQGNSQQDVRSAPTPRVREDVRLSQAQGGGRGATVRPQQRAQSGTVPHQDAASAVVRPRADLQRSAQPPEGAVEHVQDDRLPLQTPNVDSRSLNLQLNTGRPSAFASLPQAEDRSDSRHRQSVEPEGSSLALDPPRVTQQRPVQRSSRGPEGAPAPPTQLPRRSNNNVSQPLGPHPDPEGVASVFQPVRPSPQAQNFPAHSTPEERLEMGHLRPEGRESPFIPASPLPREGRDSRSRMRSVTPVEEDPRRYHGSGAGGNVNQNDGSDRVVTGYALGDAIHSVSGDRGPASQRTLAEGPNSASATRSATIGSEQNLATVGGDDRLDDRRSREPDERSRARQDRRPRRHEDEEHRERRYHEEPERYRDRRRYPGEESEEDDRSFYESRKDKRRPDRTRFPDDDELYPPSRGSVFGEDTDRYDARSEVSDLEGFTGGRRRPTRDGPYPEEDKTRRRYGRERLDSRESRNGRRDYERTDSREYRPRDPRDTRDPYRDRDYYRERDPYSSRRRDVGMHGYPHRAAPDYSMYYPPAAYDPRQAAMYDPRQLQMYYSYYAQLAAARARPGAPVVAPTVGTEERAGSRSSTTDEIRRERLAQQYATVGHSTSRELVYPGYSLDASAAETLSEVGVAVQKEKEFYDDAHVRGSFVLDGTLLKMVSGLPSHQLPSSLTFLDISEIYESLPEYEEIKTFSGPLVKGQTNISSVVRFCGDKILQLQNGRRDTVDEVKSRILLWEYLVLLLKSNGAPEGADVARLLLQETVNFDRSPLETGEITSQEDISMSYDRTIIAARAEDSAVREYRSLLNFGCKQKALEYAIKKGLWGHAFTLSSYMDQKAFNLVRNKFTNSLSVHDSLQTLYQLESGRQPAASTTLGDERKLSDWQSHLAIILSNSSRDPQLDRKSIIAMGDSLGVRGDLCAAQLCYLVAKVEFGLFSDKASRIALIGMSKWEQTSSTPAIEYVQMTEVYEYAMSLSQPSYCIKSFLIHKFGYAANLVDYGFCLEAYRYCESIWNSLKLSFTPEDLGFASQLYALSDRLKFSDPSCIGDDEYGNRVVMNPDWLSALYYQLYATPQADLPGSYAQSEVPATIEQEQEPEPQVLAFESNLLPPLVQPLEVVEQKNIQQDYSQFQQDQQAPYESVDPTYSGYYQSQPDLAPEEVSGYCEPPVLSPTDPGQPPYPFMNSTMVPDYPEQQQQRQYQENQREESEAAVDDQQPSSTETKEESSKAADKKSWSFIPKFLRKSTAPQAILPDDKNQKIVWDEAKKQWIDKDNPNAAEALATPPPRATTNIAASVATPETSTPPNVKLSTTRRVGRVDLMSTGKPESPAVASFLASTPVGPGPGTPTMLFLPASFAEEGSTADASQGKPAESQGAPSNITPQTSRQPANRRRQYLPPTGR